MFVALLSDIVNPRYRDSAVHFIAVQIIIAATNMPHECPYTLCLIPVGPSLTKITNSVKITVHLLRLQSSSLRLNTGAKKRYECTTQRFEVRRVYRRTFCDSISQKE
jgi:hypothetical protein